MTRLRKRQQGGSIISKLIILVVAGFAVFLALQYVPVMIESAGLDSVLDTLEERQQSEPVHTTPELNARIGNLLYVNQMQDMKDSFHVKKSGDTFFVEVSYERELNLGYKKKTLEYRKSRVLK